ncbi:3118_t:CDS:2 [Dentiscutata erythropus]|uniref:3118_t:CDS:1 n=1 Tax=Dentiscutata erythropus TaxID=1348616 RepID=A0A9N9G891_9GLOM|nr:3118_t:CDS:2 [Dentiscutata erythropus]
MEAISYGEERVNKILNGEEDPLGPPNNQQNNSKHNTEPSGSNFSDNLNKKQSREAYTYLNSNLHLSNHHTFTGSTLNTVSDNIASYVVNQAKMSMFLGQNAALPIYNDNQESTLLNVNEDEFMDLLDEDSFQNKDNWQRQVDKWNKMIDEKQVQENKKVYNLI